MLAQKLASIILIDFKICLLVNSAKGVSSLFLIIYKVKGNARPSLLFLMDKKYTEEKADGKDLGIPGNRFTGHNEELGCRRVFILGHTLLPFTFLLREKKSNKRNPPCDCGQLPVSLVSVARAKTRCMWVMTRTSVSIGVRLYGKLAVLPPLKQFARVLHGNQRLQGRIAMGFFQCTGENADEKSNVFRLS